MKSEIKSSSTLDNLAHVKEPNNLFFLSYINNLIVDFQVWNKNAVRDAYMGRHVFEGVIDKEGFMSEVREPT